ncbi:MAG TPA: 4a-hydroxytetrahydrobiopterin dehydratase [Ktedonobacterales bacterium]
MGNELTQQHCVACSPGEPTLSEAELSQLLPQLPDWRVEQIASVPHLTRAFTFPDFVSALAFTNAVGALAEAEGHHPALLTEWGKVTVSWWTHAIGGLHHNDIVMAAKTDAAYRSAQPQ